MPRFSTAPDDDYPIVYLADTDKPLSRTVNPHTRYAYFKLIARGGRSIIQCCKDLHLMRVVCYKSLKAEFAEDPDEQRRFVREARVSAMLQHPNTVPTYELGRDLQGHYYFTMKMVHGYTLREVLDYRERYDLTRLVEVIIQVAHALEYAHGHGVAHRDIKPENILVGPFGEVLVLDWGLAKVWHPEGTPAPEPDTAATAVVADLSLTLHGRLQGTVSYMSPEQIRMDSDLDYRTDIYSLGARCSTRRWRAFHPSPAIPSTRSSTRPCTPTSFCRQSVPRQPFRRASKRFACAVLGRNPGTGYRLPAS